MKKIMLAAVAALALAGFYSTSTAPVQAQAGFIVGGPVGVVWHAQVVNRCKKRQLTADEAKRTFIFPTLSVLRAYRDCNDKKKK